MKNLKYNICDEGHVTDAVAYLLLKEGGEMDYRKLMSLLYISERMCIDIKGEIFCNASLAITPDGPVLYEVMELIKGNKKVQNEKRWDLRLNKPEGYILSVKPDITKKNLGELHEYFSNIIDEVYEEFSDYDREELLEYMTDNYPECRNFLVNENLTPSYIDVNILLEDLGYSNQDMKIFKDSHKENELWSKCENTRELFNEEYE